MADKGVGAAAEGMLAVKFENRRPVELGDLTESLHALADEYKRFAALHTDPAVPAGSRLYVQELKQGSIIAMLVPMVPDALNMMETANTVIDFSGHLKKIIRVLTGAVATADERGGDIEKTSYENIAKILQPTARDPGAQITIGTLNVHAPIHLTFNSNEASGIREAAQQFVERMKKPTTGKHSKVMLYWYQARFAAKAKTGDKAIIESITSAPVKAVFISDLAKSKMLSSKENPFTTAYMVDVSVETVQGKPVLYRIENFYDTETIVDLQRALSVTDGDEQSEVES